MTFTIIKDGHRGYIVVREHGDYIQHAHVKTLSGCRKLISLIDEGILPRSEYLQGSCRRLLTDDEYARLKRDKDRYINRHRV